MIRLTGCAICASIAILTFAYHPSIAVTLMSNGTGPSSAAVSLCSASEVPVFSCTLKRSGKLASLCRSRDFDKDKGYIQYRFGTAGNHELEFPSDRNATQQQFFYSHYFRAQVDETEIRFDNNGYRYVIFDSYQGDMKPVSRSKGIRVSSTSGKGKETEMECGPGAKANYVSISEALPCDTESSINSGGCN